MSINITFDVDGMPPRKDGGTSMWSKEKEVNKLISLRTQFYKVLQQHKIATPINDYLKLKVHIHIPEKHLEKSDIDNLIGGICDGLQSADYSAKLRDEYLEYKGNPIHPLNSFIVNDSKVLEINAKKVIDKKRTFYRVNIESINKNEILADMVGVKY
ncbi:hypothetical protein [Neobacillus drentensis]|uniref:hypothetical protein n=1 Tax=Neobacillus drentensis TaxID=220684 RepID=UPI002FFEF6B1